MLAASLKLSSSKSCSNAAAVGPPCLWSLVVHDVAAAALQQRAEGLWHCLSYSRLSSQMMRALSFMELLQIVAENCLCAQMSSSSCSASWACLSKHSTTPGRTVTVSSSWQPRESLADSYVVQRTSVDARKRGWKVKLVLQLLGLWPLVGHGILPLRGRWVRKPPKNTSDAFPGCNV